MAQATGRVGGALASGGPPAEHVHRDPHDPGRARLVRPRAAPPEPACRSPRRTTGTGHRAELRGAARARSEEQEYGTPNRQCETGATAHSGPARSGLTGAVPPAGRVYLAAQASGFDATWHRGPCQRSWPPRRRPGWAAVSPRWT